MNTTTNFDMGTVFITDQLPAETDINRIWQSLEASGLNKASARQIPERGCFSRAKKNLLAQGSIQEVKKRDEQGRWLWQLSDKFIEENKLRLEYREHFWFDIGTQKPGSTNPEVEKILTDLMDRYSQIYLANDLLRLIHKIFDKQAGLVPLRRNGGVYFVPISQSALLEKVMNFLEGIGCRECVPIPVGQFGQGPLRDKSVVMLVETTAARIKEIQDEMAEIEKDGKQMSGRKAQARMDELKTKIERIRIFSASLRTSADELLAKASTNEIDLAALASSEEDAALALAHGKGEVLGKLMELAAKQEEKDKAKEAKKAKVIEEGVAEALDLDVEIKKNEIENNEPELVGVE